MLLDFKIDRNFKNKTKQTNNDNNRRRTAFDRLNFFRFVLIPEKLEYGNLKTY